MALCKPNIDKLRINRDIDGLLKTLGNRKDAEVPDRAAGALITIGRPAVDPLIAALTGSDLQVRRAAARVLGEIGDPHAIEPLLHALKDSRANVRAAAVSGLVKIGGPAVDPLIATLGDFDIHAREGAAVALGKLGDARAVEPLIAALGDSDERVRSAAGDAVQRLR
ncbi:MAG: HEAT repeat domain-containing protein [Methanospirillum sp.]